MADQHGLESNQFPTSFSPPERKQGKDVVRARLGLGLGLGLGLDSRPLIVFADLSSLHHPSFYVLVKAPLQVCYGTY